MPLYSVLHYHCHGTSAYTVRSQTSPSEKDAILACDIDFEPDRDESIEIHPVGEVILIGPAGADECPIPTDPALLALLRELLAGAPISGYQPDTRCTIYATGATVDQLHALVTAADLSDPSDSSDSSDRPDAIRALAREHHPIDGIEIDGDAIVSEGDDNGAYVAAWVWVSFDGTDFDKGDDDAEDTSFDPRLTTTLPSECGCD